MITVYSKNNCSQCEMAKTLLKAESIEYKEIRIKYQGDVEVPGYEYIAREDFMEKFPHIRAMPYITEDSVEIGSFIELRKKVMAQKNYQTK